jgi:hypothetical protein
MAFYFIKLPFNRSRLRLSSSNDFNEYNGDIGSLRSTTRLLGSRNFVFVFFAINDWSANEVGASDSSSCWLGGLGCWEVGVGGSDDFFESGNVLCSVYFIASSDAVFCFGLLVDGNEDCGLSFDMCCFCADGVTENDGIGCRTCELLVGKLNVKAGGFSVCWFVKEKAGGLPVCWFVKEKAGGLPVCWFVKEKRGTFPDDWFGTEEAGESVDDEFGNENDGTDPDADACVNEVPDEDPVLV